MSTRKYTPGALARELERLVGRHYFDLSVEAEISQRTVPGSGHCYLMLRDREAQLAVVMWRQDWESSAVHPKAGDRVVCTGRLGLYGGQSKYQLYARSIRLAGEGERAKKLAAIQARLAADGLLDARRKRLLPAVPGVIGVVTSPTGAALQDFLKVSRERWPAARILVAGCKVQGVDAAGTIIQAMELLAEDGRADVIVVTRGGGSREDLSAFDDEYLARWIATSPVPVISAVGHEVDTTIADLVADAVSPTPSAAAMKALPDSRQWAQRVDETMQGLHRALAQRMAERRATVEALRARLRSPSQRLQVARQRRAELLNRLQRAATAQIDRRRQRATALTQQLQALSPLAVLDRGYAIVHGPEGVLRKASSVDEGAALSIRLAEGQIAARVVPEPM
jgi:exodeoxyribonuclease VII large subunit